MEKPKFVFMLMGTKYYIVSFSLGQIRGDMNIIFIKDKKYKK